MTTSDELHHRAERLSRHILAHTGQSDDMSHKITEAIIATYGSLDTFYTMFFQYLSAEERKRFAALVEKMVQEGQAKTVADVITTSLFQNIIKTLRKHQVSDVKNASAKQRVSPEQGAGTAKGPQKGR